MDAQRRQELVQKHFRNGMKYRATENALIEAQPKTSGKTYDDDDALVTGRDLRILLMDIAKITGQTDKRVDQLERQLRELRSTSATDREDAGVVFSLPARGKIVA